MACPLFLAPLWLLPLDLLKFYNFASPFVCTFRNAARQSLCGFWKSYIFSAQKNR